MYKFQDQSEREWFTWWQVCKQLRAFGIEPNDLKYDALMKAIKLWGSEASLLDEENDDPKKFQLLKAQRDEYEKHVIGEWYEPGRMLTHKHLEACDSVVTNDADRPELPSRTPKPAKGRR